MNKTQHCPRHGDPIIEEPGGPMMPTVFGRRYCPTCQAEYAAELDAEHGLPADG